MVYELTHDLMDPTLIIQLLNALEHKETNCFTLKAANTTLYMWIKTGYDKYVMGVCVIVIALR